MLKPGELPSGASLAASINGASVPVQLDVKTSYADGSAKMGVLSIARPDVAVGGSVEALLSLAPAGTLPPPPIDINAAMVGHTFNVDITTAGVTTQIDVLAALRDALANGTASFWQSGPLASQARVEIDLAGSQRLVFDVTFFSNDVFEVQAQFNNDQVMEATGGRIVYSLAVTMDGRSVARENISQGQYENWHQTFSSDGSGGQGLGEDLQHKWLNISRDIEHLEATGAIAQYDQSVGVAASLLTAYAAATTAPGWEDPLNPDGIAQFMPATGGRADIGFTTEINTAWLITQNIQAATYALDQARASGAVPWNMWDSAHKSWLSVDNYPLLWTDPRGGTGTPGDPNSTGLTQQSDGLSGWTLDSAHQPDLNYVPYLLTGQRWILDNLQAQAAWNVVNQWTDVRGETHDLVVVGNQVRGAAWALRQIDEAAWASPDGSAAKAYFTAVSNHNWAWLVSQIPIWTAEQGEAHGWLPSVYGIAGAMPPWQQDYFAFTARSAAKQGNADALTFLKWQANFLVGRFTHGAEGFAPHDGAAYLIAISDPITGVPYKTWAEIGAATVAGGASNGTGWAQSDGDYGQLALASLAGIAEVTGSLEAATTYRALLAEKPPYTPPAAFNNDPTYAIEAPVPTKMVLSIVLGAEAWNGPPIAIVKVDGVEVFNGAVTAPHATGGAAIALGQYDPAVGHTISVQYTNDANGGTATTDRNLYVEDLLVNFASTAKSAALLTNGSVLFDLPVIPNTLALAAVLGAEAYLGNPYTIISVDGIEVFSGEVSATHASGGAPIQLGLFDALRPHTVNVAFTNDLYGGVAGADRNLYVEAITANGVSTGNKAALASNGVASFILPVAVVVPPVIVPPVIVPPTASTLRLSLSGDAWQGDAHYRVTLDGVVLIADGVTTASHAAGEVDVVDLNPILAAGPHSLVVTFTNDAWGGTPSSDRNLYVDAVRLNGVDLGKQAALMSNGDADLSFDNTAIIVPPPVVNTLRLSLSEDAWQGDARYTVTLDGVVLVADGVTTASHAAGERDLVDLHPVLAAGPHSLVISFNNDAWGGSAATDRNLYVDAISFNGLDLGKQAALLSTGSATFTFNSAIVVVPPPVPTTDTLRIGLSADSWQGDPHFLIFVDGAQVGLEHSASASRAAGEVEYLDVLVAHKAGVHELDVRYINDAWGGTPDTDRNLYVESVSLNGTDLNQQAALLNAGDAFFAF